VETGWSLPRGGEVRFALGSREADVAVHDVVIAKVHEYQGASVLSDEDAIGVRCA
jgi:hypothetical protein